MTFRLGIDPPMIKGLSINGFFSYDLYNRYQKIFRKPWTLYFPNWDSAERDANGFITRMEVVQTLSGYSAPELQENHNRYIRKLYKASFPYARELNDHTLPFFGDSEKLQDKPNTFS